MEEDRDSVLWHRKCNPMVRDLMSKNGADLEKSRWIMNYSYSEDRSEAESLAEEARLLGHEIAHIREDDSPDSKYDWVILTKLQVIPNVENLHQMTDQCVRVAEMFNSNYDGWYTEV